MPDGTETVILEAAKAAVERLLLEEVEPNSSREHVAVMAWLDGFMAGHTDATRAAITKLERDLPLDGGEPS